MTVGGDALNEATILAKHGKSVYLETVLGNDDVGKYLCSHYARHGIELSEAVVKASYMTGINVVLVQKNGERNFLTNRNGSLRKLMISDINMPFPEETKIVCFASVFVCLEIIEPDCTLLAFSFFRQINILNFLLIQLKLFQKQIKVCLFKVKF